MASRRTAATRARATGRSRTAAAAGRVRRGSSEGEEADAEGGQVPGLRAQGPTKARTALDKAGSAKTSRAAPRTGRTPSGSPGATPSSRRLRAGVPVNAVYVAEGAERDGRLREAFRWPRSRRASLLEVTRAELDRLTDGAVHQGLAARIPAYEYAHADDLLDPRRGGR